MMRITVLANRDLASCIALNLLIKSQPAHTYTILLSAKVGKATQQPPKLQSLSFLEQGLFNQLLFPLLDKAAFLPNLHDSSGPMSSFNGLARQGISVNDIHDINSPQGYQIVASHKPNLILSIRFGQILQQPIIDVPEFGVINLHSGMLPDYRGVMATFWAMLSGQSQLGTTLHYIDSPQIDAGRIISIACQSANYNQTYLHNMLSLYPSGVQQIANTLELLEKGLKPNCKSMDVGQGNYYSFPHQADLERFEAKGLQLFSYDEIVEIAQQFHPD